MKKHLIRTIALSIALLSFMLVMCSCGEKMTVTVRVDLGKDYIDYAYAQAEAEGNKDFIIPQDDRKILGDGLTIEIKYSSGDQVSVLQALQEACANRDISCQVDANGYSVEKIKSYGGFFDSANSKSYFWSYTVNGVEPSEGRAGTNYVKDGDVIVFTLTSASGSDFNEDDLNK